MAETKFVLNDVKTGKSYQKALDNNPFLNKKVGDKVSGNEIGFDGYELQITGGSDKSGCQIRRDVQGFGKKRALLSAGPGVHGLKGGKRVRKTVVANLINEDIVQINLKVLKQGSQTLEQIIPPKVEEAPVAA